MRTKKALYNNMSAALAKITSLVFGLIIPRLMIKYYGSELNGLLSSSKQIISYLNYLELGITTALIYTLYAPLASQNYKEINSLVKRSKREYEKIGLGYFLGVILISAIYPLMIKEDLGYGFVFAIIFLIGIYGTLDFLTLSKYRVLLMADQRYYVVTLASTITLVLQNVATIALLLLNQSILLVTLLPILFLPLRSLFFNLYLRKKYKSIDFSVEASKIKLDSRLDAFVSGLANTLNLSLPIVVVSLLVSLEMASVFSVYTMVFFGISGVITIFTSGMSAAFGNMFANNEKEAINKYHNYFEFLIYILITILYSVTLALIIPFIKLYLFDADINYIFPTLAILFTIWSVIRGTAIPSQTIINASGKWKLVTKKNIYQMSFLFVSMLIFGYFLGINGILVSMILAYLYRTILLMIAANGKILKAGHITTIRRILRIFLTIFLVNSPFIFNLIIIDANNYINWILWGLGLVAASTLITILVNIVFDWEAFKGLFNRYVKRK